VRIQGQKQPKAWVWADSHQLAIGTDTPLSNGKSATGFQQGIQTIQHGRGTQVDIIHQQPAAILQTL
jgi:hypothetical protein